MDKPPPELVERFGEVLGRYPDAERRQMFGMPAAFAGGHMFTGLYEDRWIVRLPDIDRAEAMAQGASRFEPMPGRPMREYVALPHDAVADEDAIHGWVDRALAHVKSLPPKPPKPSRRSR